MKKSFFILLFMSLILIISGCKKDDVKLINIISDENFERGFNLTNTSTTNKFTIPIDYQGKIDPLTDPLWEIAQWGELDASRRPNYLLDEHDLQKGTEELIGDTYIYRALSGSKEVKVNPTKGIIELNLNSQKEYGDIPRFNNEDWPHLLIQQNFGKNYYLKDLKSFIVEIDLELTKYQKLHSSATAQFQWIFNIADLNPNSQGYINKDYYWFNIPYFDARDYENKEVAKGGALIDGGKSDATKKFIYIADMREVMDEHLEIGKRVKIKFDFLPMMIEAFNLAKSDKFNCLQYSNFEDMGFSNFNIGWEVPGILDVGIKIYDLAIYVEEK